MANLTKEQAIAKHRKMWNWIADELEKDRSMPYPEAQYFIDVGLPMYDYSK